MWVVLLLSLVCPVSLVDEVAYPVFHQKMTYGKNAFVRISSTFAFSALLSLIIVSS